MKTKNLFLAILFFITINCHLNKALGQATASGPSFTNFPSVASGATDFLGWATGSFARLASKSLDIATIEPMPINFYTSGTLRGNIDQNGLGESGKLRGQDGADPFFPPFFPI